MGTSQGRLWRPHGLRAAGARGWRAHRAGRQRGGQESALFLNRGQWLAKLLLADKLLRLKSIPISLALPWGLNISDLAGDFPLPTKIVIEVQGPIEVDGHHMQDQAVHDKVLASLQGGVDRLAAERRFPVIG